MMVSRKMIVLLLVSGCCTVAGFCAEAEKQPDPYKNTSVLVEAFVVRVSTEALAEAGVNPIGQSPAGISILKIMSCLDDPEKAEVFSGAKVMVRHRNEGKVQNRNTLYVKRQNTSGDDYKAYSNGISLEASIRIGEEKAVGLEYTFSASLFEENKDNASPPDKYAFDWSGLISVRSGNPVIAGAVQNDEAVTFLILCAIIQDADHS